MAAADLDGAATAWRPGAIAVSFASFLLIGLNDGGLGVLMPSLMGGYGIDRPTAGLAFFGLNVGYLPSVLISGPLHARLGRRHYQILGAALFAAGAAGCASAPPWPGMLAALALIGFAVGIIDAGLNAYIAGLPRSGGLMHDLHASYGVGALMAPGLVAAMVAAGWAWNVSYLCWAAAALVVTVACVFLFPIPRPGGAEKVVRQSIARFLTGVLASGDSWVAGLVLFFYAGAEISLGAWSFSFLTQERGVPVLQAGWMVSGFFAGLTVGRIVAGRIGERTTSNQLAVVCCPGMVAGIGLEWASPGWPAAAAGLFVAGCCAGPIFPNIMSVLGRQVPEWLQQTTIGFAVSVGSLGAAALPWLAGNLMQRAGLWAVLPYAAGLTCAVFALWEVLNRRTAGNRPQEARGWLPR